MAVAGSDMYTSIELCPWFQFLINHNTTDPLDLPFITYNSDRRNHSLLLTPAKTVTLINDSVSYHNEVCLGI